MTIEDEWAVVVSHDDRAYKTTVLVDDEEVVISRAIFHPGAYPPKRGDLLELRFRDRRAMSARVWRGCGAAADELVEYEQDLLLKIEAKEPVEWGAAVGQAIEALAELDALKLDGSLGYFGAPMAEAIRRRRRGETIPVT